MTSTERPDVAGGVGAAPGPVPTSVDSSVEGTTAARRALLVALRKRGEATVGDLADELGISASATRQHLQPLAAAGLLAHRQERAGPGRPRRVYRLSRTADALFPTAYGDLTTELLDHVGAEDPELLARAFEMRRRTRVRRALERVEGLPLPERVRELARIVDGAGYLAEVEDLPDGTGFRLTEHNCAIRSVAERHAEACRTEVEFFREVLPDADVQRVSHIVSGGAACVYEIRPRR